MKAEHYTLLTDAVAATLEQVLGPRWDASRKEAWGAFIGLLLTVVSSAYAQGATRLFAVACQILMCQLPCRMFIRTQFARWLLGVLRTLIFGPLQGLRALSSDPSVCVRMLRKLDDSHLFICRRTSHTAKHKAGSCRAGAKCVDSGSRSCFHTA